MSMTILWVVVGVLCAVVEIAMPHMVLIFFSLGGWAAAAAAAFGLALEWQIGIFIALSILSLLLLRRHVKGIFSGRAKAGEDEGAHPMTGRTGIVSRALTPFAPGEITIGGSFWRAASSKPIDHGERVRVLGALPDDALTLHVEPLRPEDAAPEKE